MLPCTCGHPEFHHFADDGSCQTCGCLAFMVEASNCEPLSAEEAEAGVRLADRGCRAGDPGRSPAEA